MARTVGKVASVAGDVLSTLARVSARPAPESPLNATVGRARRYVMVGTDLEDYRKVRTRLGQGSFADEVTINDVILATIAGAFRSWLLTRGESVYPGTTVRAMVPVSVHDGNDPPDRGPGHRVLRRPAGRGARTIDAVAPDRLLDAPADGGWPRRAVSADTLAGLGGFAPPTMHALGARLGGMVSRRLYNVVITNVPGPQTPLYAAGARMVVDLSGDAARPRAGALDRPDVLRRRRLLRPLRRPRRHARRRRARPRRRRLAPRAARGPPASAPVKRRPRRPTGAVCRSPGSTSR